MIELKKIPFDAETFLANAGLGRRIVQMEAKQVFFAIRRAACCPASCQGTGKTYLGCPF
jgi:hypothetical protein